jgi:hypothetical protein
MGAAPYVRRLKGLSMINPAPGSARPVRRRWSRIVFVVLLGFLATSLVVIHFIPSKPGRSVTELYTYRFAATSDRFAFLHHVSGDRRDLIAYDSTRNKLKIYRPKSLTVWTLSPNGSKQGGFLIGCSEGITPDQLRAGQKVKTTLFQCQNEKCSPLFDFEGSIDSPLDLGKGDMIFIGAKPQILHRSLPFSPPFSPDFVGYRVFDFYFRTQDQRIERITDWKAVFSSASLAADQILFNFSPLPGSPTPQPPSYPRRSDIWAAKVTFEDGIPRLAFSGDRPFIEHGKDYDTKPSISPDASKTAFLSSSEHTASKGRRYGVAVVDNASKDELFTVAPEEGTQLSLPVFVDNDHVRFMSFDGQRYSFREISVSAKQEKLLGQVTPADISQAEVVYLENPEQVH